MVLSDSNTTVLTNKVTPQPEQGRKLLSLKVIFGQKGAGD